MIIQKIDNSKVLVVLGGEEMKDFSLDYNTLTFDDDHSKKILKRLMKLACDKAEFSLKEKKLLIEAVPYDSGCVLLITVVSNKPRKIYRIKKMKQKTVFIFRSVETLICTCVALRHSKISTHNSLYFYKDSYWLLFENLEKYSSDFCVLTEFSCDILSGKTPCALVVERGNLLVSHNAIKTIGFHFC